MRILVTTDNGRINGRQAIIVEPATHELMQELLDAKVGNPDTVLSIPNARLYATAGTTGIASVRPGTSSPSGRSEL